MPDDRYYRIRLYTPVEPPKIPPEIIGKAAITGELWAQISGSWQYYKIGKRDEFRLQATPDEGTIDFAADAKIAATSTIYRIHCKVVRIWRDKSYTGDWKVVIPDAKDRELIAANKDWIWEGW